MEKFLKEYDNKYSVTSNGYVYSFKGRKKELIGKVSSSGYRTILISHNNKPNHLLVHRLVAICFIDNPDNKRTVNHKDGNKLNNNVYNLEWMTDSENVIHARDSGMYSNCKITMEIAVKIRADKDKYGLIAEKYGISKSQVSSIKQNLRWKQ